MNEDDSRDVDLWRLKAENNPGNCVKPFLQEKRKEVGENLLIIPFYIVIPECLLLPANPGCCRFYL
jgi:hypothetical protein